MRRFKNLGFLLIIIIGVIPLFDLFHFGLPITHDGQDHVARIANFYKNLSEGNIIPRWAANLNWGYGHPILMFLYPLPSYMASIFHFIGFSLVDSLKIVFGLSFIASGLTMYLWLKEFLGIKSAFLGAILYMFAPYRFVDLYVRGAIGEHTAFIFPPLILYFLLKLAKKPKFLYFVGGSFSLAGLILSHNAITIMFMPLILLYFLYLLWQTKYKKKFILYTSYFISFGVGLSSFFLLPAFFEGKYTLRDIVISRDFTSRFVNNFWDFLYGQWSYGGTGVFSVQVGIIHWFLIIISLPATYILYKTKNNLWFLSIGFLFIFIFALFIMTPNSKFLWESITLIQKFQFPWRFLSVIVFASSVIGAVAIYTIAKKIRLFTVCIIFAILFFNRNYWHANGYLQKPETFYTGIYYGTTDTGESAPIWSVRFMEKPAKSNMEVISGRAKIIESMRNSTIHRYKIFSEEKSRIRVNTLYFPGWNVFIDNKKVDINDLEFQDPANRGLMTFYLEKGKHDILVKFSETKFRMVANIISGLSLLFILSLVILNRINIWHRFR